MGGAVHAASGPQALALHEPNTKQEPGCAGAQLTRAIPNVLGARRGRGQPGWTALAGWSRGGRQGCVAAGGIRANGAHLAERPPVAGDAHCVGPGTVIRVHFRHCGRVQPRKTGSWPFLVYPKQKRRCRASSRRDPVGGASPTEQEPACTYIQQVLSSPEHLSADVLCAPVVVFPVGQGWQAGVLTDVLPPADHVPTVHCRQSGCTPVKPKPGAHTV